MTPVTRVDPRPVTAVIADGVADVPSGHVIVGFNWTAVEGPTAVGLAATPNRRDGARTTSSTGSYAGQSLAELARLGVSENPYERAIGIAAANAHWNAAGSDLREAEGLSEPGSGPVVVVGRFPGLDQKLPGATVLERNPGPDDRPAADAPDVIPECGSLFVTATTLVNGSIDGLLDLAGPQTVVTVVGPGTPLCPSLFKTGIDRLGGFVVTDRDPLLRAVMEGAGARVFRRYGRSVMLESGPSLL